MMGHEDYVKEREDRPTNAVVEVLDFSALCEKAFEFAKENKPELVERYDEFRVLYTWGLINTEDGWYLICSEGVMYPLFGEEFEEMDSRFPIGLYGEGKGSMSMLPNLESQMTLEDLLEVHTVEHVPLAKFIRVHNDRLQSNYHINARELNTVGVLPPRDLVPA